MSGSNAAPQTLCTRERWVYHDDQDDPCGSIQPLCIGVSVGRVWGSDHEHPSHRKELTVLSVAAPRDPRLAQLLADAFGTAWPSVLTPMVLAYLDTCAGCSFAAPLECRMVVGGQRPFGALSPNITCWVHCRPELEAKSLCASCLPACAVCGAQSRPRTHETDQEDDFTCQRCGQTCCDRCLASLKCHKACPLWEPWNLHPQPRVCIMCLSRSSGTKHKRE